MLGSRGGLQVVTLMAAFTFFTGALPAIHRMSYRQAGVELGTQLEKLMQVFR